MNAAATDMGYPFDPRLRLRMTGLPRRPHSSHCRSSCRILPATNHVRAAFLRAQSLQLAGTGRRSGSFEARATNGIGAPAWSRNLMRFVSAVQK
jgi:hypothetical protein